MFNIKRLLALLTITLLLITQMGCKIAFIGRTEMIAIEFIRAVGVDKSTRGDGLVRLTIATESVKSSGATGQQKISEILFSEGKTVFDAVRNFWTYMEKRPFWGHLEYVIFGEEAAKEGLSEYIDYFCRDPEIRLNMKAFIAQGQSAESLIRKVNIEDKFAFERLEGVSENQWGQSVSNVVDLMEVMYILDNEKLSLYLPCIRLGKFADYQKDKTEAEDIVMGGFAIFEEDKLVDYLDNKMGRGLNWLRNAINSGVIIVKSQEGKNISLEIIDSSTKLKPQIINDELTVTVKVKMTSNIAEVSTKEDVFAEKILKYLEGQQEQIIKEEIESVINYGQNKGMEFFGTLYAVQNKYPIKWDDFYSNDWKEVFKNIKYTVVVESKINRTYNIKQPRFKETGGGK